MKVCCISDTHGKHNEIDFTDFQDCSVLVHAGDWTKGTKDQNTENIQFLEWLEDLDFEHKILICGNHELLVEKYPEHFQELLENVAPSVTYLMNSSVVIDGIKFYGSPYSNEFCGWAFMEYDHDLQTIWNKIDLDTDVLVTHGPAYMAHDLVNNNWSRNPNQGSHSLQVRKTMLPQLKVHASGHIHEAYGTSEDSTRTNSWTNVCSSILDENYKMVNKPIKLEI